MDQQLRRELAERAFLFDDPHAYLAGVEATLRAVEERDERWAEQPTSLTAQRERLSAGSR